MRRLIVWLMMAAPAVGHAQTPPPVFKPGLGDMMTMMVQPRHTKLGLAGQAGNWAYASYELHELQESFDRVARNVPKWREFMVAETMASVTKDPMAALEDAIKNSNAAGFAKAYQDLTTACNQCHQAAKQGQIVIQVPAASPFPDQDFRPAQR